MVTGYASVASPACGLGCASGPVVHRLCPGGWLEGGLEAGLEGGLEGGPGPGPGPEPEPGGGSETFRLWAAVPSHT